MKRLTINETWDECLAMWKWISRQCKGADTRWCQDNVKRLKREWLEINKQRGGLDNCFFCRYTHDRRKPNEENSCRLCPGSKVDKNFTCSAMRYNYNMKPRLFYAELKRLNKVRLAK